MKRPDLIRVLRFATAGFALSTLVLVVVYLVERSNVREAVELDLSNRAQAVADRLETLVKARARWLESLDPTRIPSGVQFVAGPLDTPWGPAPDSKFTAGLVERGDRYIEVEAEKEPNTWLRTRLPIEPVLSAMRDVWPGEESRVYLTNSAGHPFFTWPAPAASAEPASEIKRTPGGGAFDEIAAGRTGAGPYKDLDGKDAVGAWRTTEWIHGGILVERDAALAFGEIRGVQPWHVAAALTVLAGLALLARMFIPKIRFTGDLFRLYSYTKRYWWLIALTLFVMAVYAGGNMIRLALLKLVFDDVLLAKGPGAMDALMHILQLFAGIVLVMAAANWATEYLVEYVTQATINDVRCSLMSHLVTLDMRFFDRQKAGELMSRLSNDVQQTRQSLSLIFGEFFLEPLMLLGAIGAAFITNWRLTLMIFVGLPLIAFPIYRLGRVVNKYSKRRQVQRGVVTEVMLQTVTGMRTVKTFQMEASEAKRLDQASRRLLGQSIRVARTTAMSKTVIDVMNSIGALLILAIGGYMVIYGVAGVSAGDLMTLSVIMAHMYKPVKDITKTYNKIQESMAGADRIFEIIDQKPEITDRPGATPLVRPEREIAFENVSFAYSEQPVLRNIEFRANVGEVVALVGETGSGKSTVTDLVARFYDPTEGRVTIDGRDLRDYSVESIRRNVATVSQDAFLFNATVRENIQFGRPGASEEEIVEAAKAARIHDEILRMDRGYRTEVGERGGRLSGGQRQRITIARAILKDAPILILDEATSALDSETEALVQEALNRLMVGRTTFVIAHRLSTIGHADRILVLKDGVLVEQGTQEELLARESGVYRTLHRIQFAIAARDA